MPTTVDLNGSGSSTVHNIVTASVDIIINMDLLLYNHLYCCICLELVLSSSLSSPEIYTVSCIQGAVAHSRQFPFRFFSAYEVLHELEKQYEENRMYMIYVSYHKVQIDNII